jgi:hypothetical protein
MTSRDNIIKLMHLKNNILIKNDIEGYFVEKDEEAIRLWSDRDCDIVWGKLQIGIYLISIGEDLTGVDIYICPFCLKYGFYLEDTENSNDYDSCSKCEYGENHGQCIFDNPSNFDRITDEISDRFNIHSISEFVFSDSFFVRDVMELIKME